MRSLITTMALLALIGGPAMAQGGSGSGSAGATSQSQPTRDAPIGHRQPRASEPTSGKNFNDPNDPLSKENALLDKKIKSICRGC